MNPVSVTPEYIHLSGVVLCTMCPNQSQSPDRASETATTEYLRRHILAVGAGTGALMLAGCSTNTAGNDPDGDSSSSDDTDNGGSAAGTFRLLISDQPVAIDDFDELNVSFDRARIFPESSEQADDSEDGESDPGSEEDDEGDEPENDENETEDENEEETEENEENDESETEDEPDDDENEADSDEPEDDEAADDGQDGFQVIDLDNATVDLTQVVGDKATGVFEGTLEEGRYTKIELYAADVEGIVEGESVDVKIPSGKLQIVKPFEVVAGETLSFVFDINVVKKGQQQAYNLLPVISGSGVAGRDVEAEEIEGESQKAARNDDSGSETEDSEETDAEDEDTDAQAEDPETEEPTEEDDAESG